MGVTALGIHYPDSTDNVQLWTKFALLAGDVDTLITADRADFQANPKYLTETTWTTRASATTEAKVAQVTWTAVTGARYRLWVDTEISASAGGVNGNVIFRYASGSTVTTSGTQIRSRVMTFPSTATYPLMWTADLTGLAAGTWTAGLFLSQGYGSATIYAGTGFDELNRFWVERVRT